MDGRVHLPVIGDDAPGETPARHEPVRARRARPHGKRAVTVSMDRLPKRALEEGRALYPEAVEGRPQTRAECEGGARPCPYVSCVHHLYLDVSEQTGAIKMNFPDLEPWELTESCALDVADRGGLTLDEVVGHGFSLWKTSPVRAKYACANERAFVVVPSRRTYPAASIFSTQ